MPYEEIAHTADVALRVWGRTLEELFLAAAEGMFRLAGATGEAQSADAYETSLEVEAPDVETLLVTWLNELLWLTEGEGWLPTRYEVKQLGGAQLNAVVTGTALAALNKHIKAVTFNEVEVKATEAGYETVLVFDV